MKNEKQFEALYNKEYKKVLNAVTNKLSSYKNVNKSESEDITQGIFINLFKMMSNQKIKNADLPKVLWKIYKNTIFNKRRDDLVRSEDLQLDADFFNSEIDEDKTIQFEDESINIPEEVDAGIAKEELLAKLSNLKTKDRNILRKRYLEEKSFSEISRELKLNESGVRQRCNRALESIRKEYLTV